MMVTMGQERTAETLYREHLQREYQLCLRLAGGNIAWAEDATQDVFVKLLLLLQRLEQTDDLGAWIYRVTMNTCMTRLKREGSVWGRLVQLLSGSTRSASTETPERRLAVRRDLEAAFEALSDLPAKQRVVFCMRYLDDQPQQQISATLEMSEGYVSKLLARTRAHLQQQGWEAPDA